MNQIAAPTSYATRPLQSLELVLFHLLATLDDYQLQAGSQHLLRPENLLLFVLLVLINY